MSTERIIQEKMLRLQELRQYQAYYGPNTPYPVVVEINQLETELGHILRAEATRSHKPKKQKKKTAVKTQAQPQPQPSRESHSSQTTDVIVAIGFIGWMFVLGGFLLMMYVYSISQTQDVTYIDQTQPVLRPTFTPTLDPNIYQSQSMVAQANVLQSGGSADAFLPTPSQATEVPTLVPTVTPHTTDTPTVAPPTATPEPTKFPPTPIPVRMEQPAPTATPSAPTAVPAPTYPFYVTEQGNREFQRTTFHMITIYVAVVSPGNIPMGDFKVIGNHSSGRQAESPLSTWNWSATNCLDCDYVKQANLKFEPGPFEDGVWTLYLADTGGNQISAPVTLNYSSDPDQWVWDFMIFQHY